MTRRSLAFLLIALLLGLFALGAWQFIESGGLSFFDSWAMRIMAGLALLGVVGSLPRLFRTHRNRGMVLLWCRRFGNQEDRAGKRNSWARALLTDAARDLVLPITLRDSSVGWARSLGDGIEVLVTLPIVFTGLGGFLWLTSGFADSTVGFLFLMAVLVLICVFLVVVVTWILTSLASYRGEPEQLRQRVRDTKASGRSLSETLVVRCNDQDWQAYVEVLLEEADLAVLDLTGSSDNIDWEISRAIELLGPERVLFFQEEPGSKTLERVVAPSPLEAGGTSVPNCQWLRYGADWVVEERRAYLKTESEGGTALVRGHGSAEVAKALREWIMDTVGQS